MNFSQGINTLLPDSQASRGVARLLALDAVMNARRGQSDRVAKDVLAIFSLSDAMRFEPCLISLLVRNAIRAIGIGSTESFLSTCDWTDQQLKTLQSAIGAADFKDSMRRAMCRERAVFRTGLNQFSLGPFRAASTKNALPAFSECLDSFDRPGHDVISVQQEISQGVANSSRTLVGKFTNISLSLMFPALDSASTSGARAEARQLSALAALSVKRHFLLYGEFPGSLADIGPELLPERLKMSGFTDPFSGDTLLYLQNEAGVKIYSIGENQADDGGDVNSNGDQQRLDVGVMLRKQ